MARPKDLLSATAVRAAHFEGRTTKLFDGGGLFLLLNPSGKYWRLKYRFGGREKVLALGVYPAVSLKAARAGRDEAQELPAKGIDPSTHRRATRALASSAHTNTLDPYRANGGSRSTVTTWRNPMPAATCAVWNVTYSPRLAIFPSPK